MIDRLKSIGVHEVACLIDFGVDVDVTLQSLRHLDELRTLELARWESTARLAVAV
jgi:hypothetical protein